MLTEEQKRRYREILDLAKQELDILDKQLAAEIAQSKARILEMQEARKVVKLICDGAYIRLGEKNDLKAQNFDFVELEKQG